MDDLISRQAAIDKINERQRKLIYCFGFENDMVKIMDIARSIIIAMPSAQPEYRLDEWCTDCKEYDTEKHCCPRFNQVIRTTLNEMKSERKKGKWIYGEDNPGTGRDGWFCSECEHFEMWDYSADMKSAELNLPNFCPNCGARMTEEDV